MTDPGRRLLLRRGRRQRCIEHGKPEHAEGAFYVWTKDEIDARARRGSGGDFQSLLRRRSRTATRPRAAIRTASSRARTSLIQRLTARGGGEAFQKDRGRDRGLARGLAEETFRPARQASAPASRRQDHHRLERPDDLRLRPRRAGARRPALSRRRADAPRRFIREKLLEGRRAAAQLPRRARATSRASPTTTPSSSRGCSISTRRTSTPRGCSGRCELQAKQDAALRRRRARRLFQRRPRTRQTSCCA